MYSSINASAWSPNMSEPKPGANFQVPEIQTSHISGPKNPAGPEPRQTQTQRPYDHKKSFPWVKPLICCVSMLHTCDFFLKLMEIGGATTQRPWGPGRFHMFSPVFPPRLVGPRTSGPSGALPWVLVHVDVWSPPTDLFHQSGTNLEEIRYDGIWVCPRPGQDPQTFLTCKGTQSKRLQQIRTCIRHSPVSHFKLQYIHEPS